MKLLVAPIHYILDVDEGSEYTRAYEFLRAVSKKKDISGDVLVYFSSFKKIGNLNIISFSNKKPNYISNLLRLKFIFWILITSLKLLRKRTYDCIWHLGPFAIGETFSLLAIANRKKIRFVLGPIYTPFPSLGKDDFGLFGKKILTEKTFLTKFKHKIERMVYVFLSKMFYFPSLVTLKMCSEVIAMEEAGKELLNGMGVENVHVITLGINFSKFSFDRKFAKKTKVELLTVGYLISRKRINDIVEAVDITVHTKGINNIHLTIVGDGVEKDSLEKLVSLKKLNSFITFVGYIPRTELGDYYKSADIFVCASIVESAPGMYFEAMAAGMPLILAENNSSQDLKKHDLGGYVVEQMNPNEISKKIAILVKNRELIGEFGRRNIKIVHNHYNFNKNINKLIMLFKGI